MCVVACGAQPAPVVTPYITDLGMPELDVSCDDVAVDRASFDPSSANPGGGAPSFVAKRMVLAYADATSKSPVLSLQTQARGRLLPEATLRVLERRNGRAHIVWRHEDGVLEVRMPETTFDSTLTVPSRGLARCVDTTAP